MEMLKYYCPHLHKNCNMNKLIYIGPYLLYVVCRSYNGSFRTKFFEDNED
jgi:hypothetical protein